jgi:hypothetical protein
MSHGNHDVLRRHDYAARKASDKMKAIFDSFGFGSMRDDGLLSRVKHGLENDISIAKHQTIQNRGRNINETKIFGWQERHWGPDKTADPHL